MACCKSGLGETIEVPDEKGTMRPLRIDGLLQDSVFQSGLLMSEANFLKLYPDHEGYNFFLIEAPAGQEAEIKAILETALADRGIEVTSTARRLEAYLAVENTYLTTFQALGGLGLVLGSLGLAVVLLRGVWERRGELALLLRAALGAGRRSARLVLAENGFLLLVGPGAGTTRGTDCWRWHRAASGPGECWRCACRGPAWGFCSAWCLDWWSASGRGRGARGGRDGAGTADPAAA